MHHSIFRAVYIVSMLLGAVCFSTPVFAQRMDALIGQRVRVISRTIQPIQQTGIVLSDSTHALRLLTQRRDTISVFLMPSDQLEISRGKRRWWKVGALVGGSVTAGAILIAFRKEPAISLGLATLGAGAGVLWGGLIGRQIQTERWERVPRPGLSAGVGW